MPDDIKVVAAVGDDTVAPPVATDLIAGKHYQKIKFGWGVDGSFAETADTDGIRVPVGGAQIGTLTETAPASDTASSGLNGRLQRIAQRLTSLIALLPAALTTNGGALKTGSIEVVLSASVPAGQLASNAVDLAGIRNWGIFVPTTFDGTQIQFSACDTLGGTYVGVFDITNTRVVVTTGSNRFVDVPGELMALRFIQIVCLTVQSTTSTDFLIVGKS